MRTPHEIKHELQQLSEQRVQLWRELSQHGADEQRSAEIARLNERIEQLWTEERVVRSRTRFGDPNAIIARARAEERLEREYAKVA